ncbi:MAG TPA: DUF4160 domain-containing protein [Rhodothermales bacterium]|nr:DUF4160 domain-containing protein [Rhodothermales bacterium]
MSPRLKQHLIPGPYRFYIVLFDCTERAHIHVDRENKSAKFWLEPVALASNYGYRKQDLRDIERKIPDNHQTLLSFWDEYCRE